MRFLAPFVIRPKKVSSSLGNSAMTFAAAVESNEFWNAKYNKNYYILTVMESSAPTACKVSKKIAKKSAAIFDRNLASLSRS